MAKTMNKVTHKQMRSFRFRKDIIEMLSILSKELYETRTRIIEMLIEGYFLEFKKNKARRV